MTLLRQTAPPPSDSCTSRCCMYVYAACKRTTDLPARCLLHRLLLLLHHLRRLLWPWYCGRSHAYVRLSPRLRRYPVALPVLLQPAAAAAAARLAPAVLGHARRTAAGAMHALRPGWRWRPRLRARFPCPQQAASSHRGQTCRVASKAKHGAAAQRSEAEHITAPQHSTATQQRIYTPQGRRVAHRRFDPCRSFEVARLVECIAAAAAAAAAAVVLVVRVVAVERCRDGLNSKL
jgi:hypothetical protein